MSQGQSAPAMDCAVEPVDRQPVPTAVPWKTSLSGTLRFKFFLTGFLFPLVCLVIVAFSPDGSYSPHAPWQSGDPYDYLVVLMRPPAILWFYPLIAFSLGCLVIWCCRPYRFSSSVVIRIGLYTGAILALTFAVLLSCLTLYIGQIMAVVVMTAVAVILWAVKKFAQKLTRFSILNLMVFTTIVAVLMAMLGVGSATDDVSRNNSFVRILFLSLLSICGGAPTMGFITFLRTSAAATYLADKPKQGFGFVVGGWLVWIAGLATSWKFAIDTMLDEYAQLPTTDPNCYISSAAASGHSWLVGSRTARVGFVNLQMKRCKFLEIVLISVCPKTARQLRKFYDWIGPFLADLCRCNVLFADSSYLVLKPAEWIAMFVVWILKLDNRKIDRLYERTEN